MVNNYFLKPPNKILRDDSFEDKSRSFFLSLLFCFSVIPVVSPHKEWKLSSNSLKSRPSLQVANLPPENPICNLLKK